MRVLLTDMKCRSAAGVLVSDPKGRDVKIDQYTLSFHGRLLIEGAEIALNYGQRYGLLGENGSGKVSAHPVHPDLPCLRKQEAPSFSASPTL